MFIEVLQKIISIQNKIQARDIPRNTARVASSVQLELLQLKSKVIADIGKDKRKDLRDITALVCRNKVRHIWNKQAFMVKNFLLPITKLAHLYEINGGSPDDHAYKLAVAFGDYTAAVKYLAFYANEQKSCNQPVREACSFALPPEDYDFAVWQGIAVKYMQFAWFRRMLPYAGEIESSIIAEHAAAIKLKTENLNNIDHKHTKAILTAALKIKDRYTLKAAITEIAQIKKTYKALRDKRVKGQALTPTEETSYGGYAQTLLTAQLNLVTVSAELVSSVDDAPAEVLQAHHAKFMAENEMFAYFVKHGLTQKDYAKFNSLTCVDSAAIPEIRIDGSTIGYPGYYLRRLNVSDRKDAAMAACLGKLSNCCQSLSNSAGEDCTIHGLTSPYGGFYVVCKGDIVNQSIDDALVCQSWVWLSTSGAIVVDSIESIHKYEYENNEIYVLARAFYQQLSVQLIAAGIPQICLGLTSGISSNVKMKMGLLPTNEQPIDYTAGRDSAVQCLLAAKKYMFLLPGYEDVFFHSCQSANLSATALEYMCLLDFALKNSREDLLTKYLQQFPDAASQKLVADSRDFFAILHASKFEHVRLKELLRMDARLLTLTGKNYQPVLLIAVELGQWELVQWLAVQYFADKPCCDLNAKTNIGTTALMSAALYGEIEIVRLLCDQYFEGKPRCDVNATENTGQTALIMAVLYNEFAIVQLLCNLSLDGKPRCDLNMVDEDGKTALMYARGESRAPIKALLEAKLREQTLAREQARERSSAVLFSRQPVAPPFPLSHGAAIEREGAVLVVKGPCL